MANDSDMIVVEVVYALPNVQQIITVDMPAGCTAEQAINESGLLDKFPDINLEKAKVGIFGKAATMTAILSDGDRVEIYRPLIADPKEVRRKRAAEGKKMKKGA